MAKQRKKTDSPSISYDSLFSPGETVRLKSGGAPMTIESVTGDILTCVWCPAYGSRVMREDFTSVLLRHVYVPN
jgi:uncharacterized protein YodC (DUF2158 family)